MKSDRLNAFFGQFGDLPTNIDTQVRPRILACEAIVKEIKDASEFGFKSTNLADIHAMTSEVPWCRHRLTENPDSAKIILAL
jgi:hypothetical protein